MAELKDFDASLEQYEYNWHMYSANKPNYVILNPNEKIYSINLQSREIETKPDWLSVEDDHNAVQLIFSVDRYYDTVDLADTCCIIQFITTNRNTHEPFYGLYPVRYYDVITQPNKILIPWSIPISVTQTAQDIQYNFRFFKLGTDEEDSSRHIIFNLNTLSATSKILDTLNVYTNSKNGVYDITNLEYEDSIFNLDSAKSSFEQLVDMYKELYNTKQLYWETPDTINSHTYNNDFLNEES